MNQNQKRIVIIEGDAFDADAIVAIVKFVRKSSIGVWLKGGDDVPFEYEFEDDSARDKAMALAIEAWRSVVGYLPVVEPLPPATDVILPYQPEEQVIIRYWSDEKGRYQETYGGSLIYTGSKTGRFIWNFDGDGPPRKNPLGEGASPIGKIYVDESGKPLALQPN